jgi:hypothetical protein
MKRLTLCLALVLPLALAGAAEAKEIVSAKVCGASDCRTTKDRDALVALSEGGGPTRPPDASPFYRVELTVRGDGELFTFPVVIVPDAELMRGGTEAEGYTWMPVSPKAVGEFRQIARGLEPVPAARLAGLDVRLPGAQVDEVVLPPAEPDSGGSGAPVWAWIVLGMAALGLPALAVAQRVPRDQSRIDTRSSRPDALPGP